MENTFILPFMHRQFCSASLKISFIKYVCVSASMYVYLAGYSTHTSHQPPHFPNHLHYKVYAPTSMAGLPELLSQ